MPLPFEYSMFNLDTRSLDKYRITEENFIQFLTTLCEHRPMCCHIHTINFALAIAEIDNTCKHGGYIVLEDWLCSHCLKKFGTNWNTKGSDFTNTLYNILNYYVDRIEKLDTMFAQEFDLPLFFNFVKDRTNVHSNNSSL